MICSLLFWFKSIFGKGGGGNNVWFWQPIAQISAGLGGAGFYGNSQNTQRRPAAEAREETTYMDAILHNVHFPCKPADPHIPMAEDLRDRTLKNVRCYAQDALRDIWHCRSTSWWKGTKRRRNRSQFTLCSVKFGVIWRYGMYGIGQLKYLLICLNLALCGKGGIIFPG